MFTGSRYQLNIPFPVAVCDKENVLLFVLTYVLYPPIFAFRAIAGDHIFNSLPATVTTKNINNRIFEPYWVHSISFRAVQVCGRTVDLL